MRIYRSLIVLFSIALAYLGGWSAYTQTVPAEKPERTARVGAGLYQQNCMKCHGADGKGKEVRGDAPTTPDFTSHKWQQQRSDAQLSVSIRDGKGERMPPFSEKLNREQVRELVSHIRQFDPEK
jgi:cytochrome c oxidase cbb3-type subunit 3